MTKGRHHKHMKLDGRRCEEEKCKKTALDKVEGKYLCKKHSPLRSAFQEINNSKKKQNG